MEKFIMAAGTAVRINDTGYSSAGLMEGESDKPVLVLLHGYLESLDVWDDFLRLLTPRLRIITLDVPGHGISEVKGEIHTMEFLADTVNGVLENRQIDRCFMGGHSMGGYVLMEFLRKYPEKLEGLITIHSTPNPDSDEKKENRQREINLIEAGKKELLAPNAAKGFAEDNRRRFASTISELIDQISITEDEGIIAILRGMCERIDANEILAGSKVPKLFIFGRKDEHISVETAEKIIGKNPDAEVLWLENSGHMGFVEESVKCAEAITAFCTKYYIPVKDSQ